METVNLKVAIVLNSFPTVSETFIVNQITDLIDRGHDVRIFAFNKNNSEVVHQKILDYELIDKTSYLREIHVSKFFRYFEFIHFLILNRHQINFKKLSTLFDISLYGRKAINLRNYTKFKWILDSAPFDIIHVHFGTVATYIADMKSMGFFSKIGFVTSFHGYDISPHLMTNYPVLYKKLFQQVDVITVNTIYAKSLLNNLPFHKKTETLPVGVDTRQFKKTGLEKENSFTLLFVGRLIELKGPHLAVMVLNALIRRGYKDIRLKIVGEGILRSQLENSIRNYGLKENIELTGYLPQEEIIKVMETSHVFIFPGIHDSDGRAETQGLVIQEAQAMELPVIVSDVGGMKYGVKDGETGYVIKEGDIEDFANKIEKIMLDETLRIELGCNGRQYVIENYDSHSLGLILEEIYKKLA